MLNLVFSLASGAGAWVALRIGVGMDSEWCWALSVLWTALIHEGLRYGSEGLK